MYEEGETTDGHRYTQIKARKGGNNISRRCAFPIPTLSSVFICVHLRLKLFCSVVKSVLQLNGKLAGIVEVCFSERVAVVFQIAGVAQIEGGHRDGPLLAERFSNRNVCLCVRVQVSRLRHAIAVEET